MLPAVVVAPPCLHVANPPYSYTHEMKAFKFNLKEQLLPFFHPVQQIARPHFIQFPDPRVMQLDSGIKKKQKHTTNNIHTHKTAFYNCANTVSVIAKCCLQNLQVLIS